MGREGVAEEVGVHASGLEAGSIRELAEDQERTGARQRTARALRKSSGRYLRSRWTAEREVSPHGLRSRPPERDQALLVSLAERPDHSLVEGDATFLEPDRLGDAQAGAIEQLDERAVAKGSRARAGRRVDEALGLDGESARGSVRARRGS